MSRMSTVPVFACRACGAPVYVTMLSTTLDDPDSKLLNEMMKGLADIALCPEHKRQWNWYARQNRADEFFKNLFNPEAVLYNVRDGISQVDWYGNRS